MGNAPLEDFTQAYPKFLSCQAQNLDAFALSLSWGFIYISVELC